MKETLEREIKLAPGEGFVLPESEKLIAHFQSLVVGALA